MEGWDNVGDGTEEQTDCQPEAQELQPNPI